MRKVLAIHFTKACNRNCPFCYERLSGRKELKQEFWFELVRYLPGLFRQVALGGGEPSLFPEFCQKLVKECHRHGIPISVTTNGTNGFDWAEEFDLVSVSFDSSKWPSLKRFLKATEGYRERLGVNLLLEEVQSLCFVPVLASFFPKVYILLRKGKKWSEEELMDIRKGLLFLSREFDNLYIDDSIRQVLRYGSTSGWKTPCHFGKEIISIHPDGTVSGCSFDRTPLFKLREPRDILKVEEIRIPERFSCPFLLEDVR